MDNTSLVTKVHDSIYKVENTITWIAFSIMLALLIIQVLCRYIMNWPLAWAEEMVRYTYIAVSFIGATVAVRENSHISIDILPNLLNVLIKKEKRRNLILDALDILAALIAVVFWAVMSLWMIRYNLEISRLNQITTANEWPMSLMCLPVTVSCVMMAVQSALNGVEKGIEIKLAGKGGIVE